MNKKEVMDFVYKNWKTLSASLIILIIICIVNGGPIRRPQRYRVRRPNIPLFKPTNQWKEVKEG